MINSLDKAAVIAKLRRFYLQKDYKPVSLWLLHIARQEASRQFCIDQGLAARAEQAIGALEKALDPLRKLVFKTPEGVTLLNALKPGSLPRAKFCTKKGAELPYRLRASRGEGLAGEISLRGGSAYIEMGLRETGVDLQDFFGSIEQLQKLVGNFTEGFRRGTILLTYPEFSWHISLVTSEASAAIVSPDEVPAAPPADTAQPPDFRLLVEEVLNSIPLYEHLRSHQEEADAVAGEYVRFAQALYAHRTKKLADTYGSRAFTSNLVPGEHHISQAVHLYLDKRKLLQVSRQDGKKYNAIDLFNQAVLRKLRKVIASGHSSLREFTLEQARQYAADRKRRQQDAPARDNLGRSTTPDRAELTRILPQN